MIKGFIFDLDGVIVDTAKYHYLAWKQLAHNLGVNFTEEENENLKGVSRMKSLEYILELGNIDLKHEEKLKLAAAKNEVYVEYISKLKEDEILPGALNLLKSLQSNNIKIALGSASKNSKPILEGIKLLQYFDFISDGNSTDKSKPDPEVFLIAANGINLYPKDCLVIEDSIKGIEAAIAGGFLSLGIGDEKHLGAAMHVIPNLKDTSYESINKLYYN
jgi:beta-phosphoglucomutase